MSQVSIKNVFQNTGACCAYLIGSGFATGQEILQFFASYGFKGVLGAVFAMILYCIMGPILTVRGFEIRNQPTNIFQSFFGRRVGTVIDILAIFFVFGSAGIMVAGSGAVAQQYFGVTPTVGYMTMAILALITVLAGLQKLVDIIGTIGPIIIVFTLGIAFYLLGQHMDALSFPREFSERVTDLRPAVPGISGSHAPWWGAGGLYFAFNVMISINFFGKIGGECNSRREAMLTGVLSGFAFMAAVIAMLMAMFLYYGEVSASQVPSLILSEKISHELTMLFMVVIYLGIYSSVAPMYWVIQDEIMHWLPKIRGPLITIIFRFRTHRYLDLHQTTLVTVVVGIAILMLGAVPFDVLVHFVYAGIGWCGIFISGWIIGKTCHHRWRSSPRLRARS